MGAPLSTNVGPPPADQSEDRPYHGFAIGLELPLEDAFALFRRLGVDVQQISAAEFADAYLNLAKRYHPDRGNQKSHELMANINAARATILKHYQV
jgi:DnaJ-class molecular chaperone